MKIKTERVIFVRGKTDNKYDNVRAFRHQERVMAEDRDIMYLASLILVHLGSASCLI